MLLKKGNMTRTLTNKDIIKIFKDVGWEEVKENSEKELTVKEIKAILTEKGIDFDDKAKKDELLALLPQE